MINAKEEFLVSFKGLEVKCAYIEHRKFSLFVADNDEDEKETLVTLKVDYTEKEFEQFLSDLDFEYDDGFGGQQLFGTVWFADGSWATRGEYDGSEWWQHHRLLEIPKELLR